MSIRLPFALVISLLVAGCATATPAPVVRLLPRGRGATWVAGREAVIRVKGGVRVAVAFEQQEERYLALRVEIENGGTRSLDVDPAEMMVTPCTSENTSSCGATDWVIDPERKLYAIDTQRSRERARASDDRTSRAPLIFLAGVGDLANAADGHLSSNVEAQEIAGNQDEARHQHVVERLEAEKERWLNVSLRHTTLLPGRSTSGIVYVPIHRSARFIWFQVDFGNLDFPFCFEQTVTGVS